MFTVELYAKIRHAVMMMAEPQGSGEAVWGSPQYDHELLVAGFSFYVTERVDQGSKMDGTRHYGSDLQNSLRKRSQFFG